VNRELNRKFREIRGKCIQGTPDAYPAYCHRAVLDILSLLNQITAELADNKDVIEDLALVDGFVKMEDLLS